MTVYTDSCIKCGAPSKEKSNKCWSCYKTSNGGRKNGASNESIKAGPSNELQLRELINTVFDDYYQMRRAFNHKDWDGVKSKADHLTRKMDDIRELNAKCKEEE